MATTTYKIGQDENWDSADNKNTMIVTVEIPDSDMELYTDYQWDSKLGIVTAKKNGKRVVVPHTGVNQTGVLDPNKPVYKSNNIVSIQQPILYY